MMVMTTTMRMGRTVTMKGCTRAEYGYLKKRGRNVREAKEEWSKVYKRPRKSQQTKKMTKEEAMKRIVV